MVTVLESMSEGGFHLSWASSPRGGGELGSGWHPRGWRGGWEVAAVRVLAHQASEENSIRTLDIWVPLHQ